MGVFLSYIYIKSYKSEIYPIKCMGVGKSSKKSFFSICVCACVPYYIYTREKFFC